MAMQTTTQQVINFIQRSIAEAHAAGEDIVTLLSNPEVAFCLQVLDGAHINAQQSSSKVTAAKNIDQQDVELPFARASANSFNDSISTSISYL